MGRFFNPGGHNWGPPNLDGYGILQVVFAIIYSIFFYIACGYVWHHRNHPVIQKRKIGLALLSINILHVYLIAVFLVYTLNGTFPCSVEFWIIYLPIGIGLFQAQNQQLLIVSSGQNRLRHYEECKPLYPTLGRGPGGPRYWIWRLKLWWKGTSQQGKYEGFVLVGMVVQFWVSLIIYLISRKFSASGITSSPASPGMCRRGWEWAPSIIWQLLWNFAFGPYLLWKIRGIRDIYHWRLQTTIAIVAGLPGPPLWLLAVYTDSFASVNRWFVPPMWLVPGLIAMKLTTVLFPIKHIFDHKKQVKETQKALADFETKKREATSTASSSLRSPSLGSKKGAMYSMDLLDECLASDFDRLMDFTVNTEFTGENILFLTKVLKFKIEWDETTGHSINPSASAAKAMFRSALSIYVQLIHTASAHFPINIESFIYADLEKMFGPATLLLAAQRRGSDSAMSITSTATPWEVESPNEASYMTAKEYPLKSMSSRSPSRSESSEHILTVTETPIEDDNLADFQVPAGFDKHVFDAAYNSVRYMVWTGTWQKFHKSKRGSTSSV